MMNLVLKKITNIEDFKKLIEVQRSAWGFSDAYIEPHFLMTRVQKYGGLVMGLFADDQIIGFSYAVLGKCKGEYFVYSHMAAVRKEYQGKGYGFLIKQAQRDEVLKMGYDIIRWNFDPLEASNSFFNIHRLGVISDEYEENIYGVGESGLHQGLPTDRLIATWYLNSERVKEKISHKAMVNIIRHLPPPLSQQCSGDIVYIEIPRDIRSIKEVDADKALQWRLETREQFQKAFRMGFVAKEIVFSEDNSRIFFKLFK